ncbi:hypothetical protein GCM10009839_28160 [Catenulispora yoronensis]|uniref:Uncharacterized protein n=1 Tax=Catenulispora yoronensis TaxID=450799 RepID=A0ABP5FK39_9ACTN
MKGRIVTLSAVLVVVALLGGALWFANRPGPSAAKAGDCITAPLKGGFKKVGCDAGNAAFKVAAALSTGDSNGCDAYPNVIMSVVDKAGTKTLCLAAAK